MIRESPAFNSIVAPKPSTSELFNSLGYFRTQMPRQNDDRFRAVSRHTNPLLAFSTSNSIRNTPPEPVAWVSGRAPATIIPMTDSTRPRSPFAGTIDFHDGAPLRLIAPEALARTLQAHELYVESEQRSGKRANLDATDLVGKSFAGMKLWRIRMQRADLAGADFAGADLRRAMLIGARMQRGRLAAADLTRARLSGIVLTDAVCEGVCLAEADMEFAIMANSDFRNANFRDADMSGAILDGADLSGADLRRANLRGASFQDTRLHGADLRDARMGGAILKHASFNGADLRGAYLRVARFHRTDLSGADLRDVEGLTSEQIDHTIRDAQTRLPQGSIAEQEDGE